jgi:mannose-1-phosphate guanylyltransferase/mannose-6-phosphate isomerase
MTADSPPPPLVPVILAGGSGTRLWPLSRAALPKHLVELVGEGSLLQQTARRLLAAAPAERVILVGAAGQAEPVTRQLRALDPALTGHLVLEPAGRNTAAAVALAALEAQAGFGPACVLWVCPSDHLITAPDALLQAMRRGFPAAAAGELVTFGIHPTRPETGFGWIRAAAPLPGHPGVLRVERFVEKPPLEAAQAMLAAGGHAWNSGMFLFRADRILAELRRHEPALVRAVEAAFSAARRDGALLPDPGLWAEVPAQPIDKAVMERSDRVACVPCDPGWSDVGSWHALWELAEKDVEGNVTRGDVVLHDAGDTLVEAGTRLVAVAGVSGLVVVETADAVLVADRRDGEAVRGVVAALGARREARESPWALHPWGESRLVARGDGYCVRELRLDPGAVLPRPLASHRIVEGTVEPHGTGLRNAGAGMARIVEITAG